MISERIHPDTPVAVEDSNFMATIAPAENPWRAQAKKGQRDREHLGVISMATSLLALNGVLVGGTLAAAPETHFADSLSLQASHPSICLIKRAFDVVFAACALLTFLPVLLACAIAMRLES